MAQGLRIVVDHEDGVGFASRPGRRPVRDGAGGACVGGHREGEGEPGAPAGSGARRPDASAMGLDQPLADGEAETRPADPGPGLAARLGGVLAEQMRQALGRDAPPLVGDRDRDMQPVALGRDPDRRGLRRLPRRVRQQVVQHLLDARAVGHDARQVRRQVDQHRVAPAAGEEGGARPVHEKRHLRRLG